MKNEEIHETMKRLKTYLLMGLLLGGFASCITDTLDAVCGGVQGDEQDMYLRVSVPRTYASTGPEADKEKAIETLDMLVFAPNKLEPDRYSVKSASPGKLVEGADNRFQVVMPVGKGFIVHVFINSHEELVKHEFYNKVGHDMEATLEELTSVLSLNAEETKALPMHGFRADVTIDKDNLQDIDIPVLRSVSAVQVAVNGTIDEQTQTVKGGKLVDENGHSLFDLQSLYTYFQAESGRVAALMSSYEAETEATKNVTRNVVTASMVKDPSVKALENREFITIKETDADKGVTGCMYMYENKAWSTDGSDLPTVDVKYATTRLVVGGVYKGENPNNKTATYYRIDITGDGELVSLLRNHKYTFNITSVTGSGYETPDEAATGVPININIKVIDWVNELENVDFDGEHYFYSATKKIVLPRAAGTTRSIEVASDVPVDQWVMGAFAPETGRYTVEKTADGKQLRFTVSKAYSDAGERDATFQLKVKNLTITYQITQVDKSSDDWGDGGDDEVGL